MDNPELYHNSNEITRVIASDTLNDYSKKIKWRGTGDKIIDIGCGDGGVTGILKRYIPKNYDKFYLCDINQKMLDFAKDYLKDDKITYRILDMEGELSDDLKGSFNHLFSFLLFHWIVDQEKAFRNVYNILEAGGDCLLTVFGYTPAYHAYDILSRSAKWSKTWIKDVKKFQSPYFNVENPEKVITEMLHKIGFIDVHVECKKKAHVFENGASLWSILRSVDAYDMPSDVYEDFMQDFVKVGKDIGLLTKDMNDKMTDIEEEITFSFSLLSVYARKPGTEQKPTL